MKKYIDYMQEAGVPAYSSRPENKYVWHAYKNGSLVYTSEVSRADAELSGDTKIVERVLRNEEEVNAWLLLQKETSTKAFELWYADLREEYSSLNDEVFNLCYDQAWDRGHSAGYDEVESYMQDVVSFAEKIIKASSN
jgi:hypothetical protein